QGRLTQLANDIDQPAQPPQYMQRMGGRKHIEKGTTGVRGQIEPLGAQLQPRGVLTSHKKQAEDERYVEPAGRALSVTFQTAHESGDAATRNFKSNAAGDEDQRVEVEDRRQREGLPIQR